MKPPAHGGALAGKKLDAIFSYCSILRFFITNACKVSNDMRYALASAIKGKLKTSQRVHIGDK